MTRQNVQEDETEATPPTAGRDASSEKASLKFLFDTVINNGLVSRNSA